MLLEVENLAIRLALDSGATLHAVRHVGFTIDKGECLALVGESGSGKSLTALAIPGLLPRNASRSADTLRLNGTDLACLSQSTLARRIRGRSIGYVFQEPMTALNPVYSIGRQLIETMLHHGAATPTQAHARAIVLLDRVGIAAAERRLASYPHEFSGGQRQRIMIAMALMNSPELLIADEPTTALDVTIQGQILDLLDGLRRELGMGMLLISHNLASVAGFADRVAVMYAGEIVEQAPAATLFEDARHPYTQGLLRALIDRDTHAAGALLPTLPGTVQSFYGDPTACIFAGRCFHATDRCLATPPKLGPVAAAHEAACHFADSLTLPPRVDSMPLPRPPFGDVVLEARDVSKVYRVRAGLFKPDGALRAVNDVSIKVPKGVTLAIVGESGCGKSTLARILLGLEAADGGAVLLKGKTIDSYTPAARASLVQAVFQDPYSSLNPVRSVSDLVMRPLDLARAGTPASRRARVASLLEKVGLPARLHHVPPGQLSGGQRQRVAIARALATEPEIIVCDEPTSALDVSVQAQILNVLIELRREFQLSLVFISHDLAVVGHLADDIAVMYLGEIVEYGRARDIIERPLHPYTRALLESAPRLAGGTARDPSRERRPAAPPVGAPSPLGIREGCAFGPRCPHHADICESPTYLLVQPDKRSVRCHRVGAIAPSAPARRTVHEIAIEP
ncbi:hypothetical protein CAL29_12050 [Bordetella genomosp. 10]|uniref:ABC transporter domain-containing protein n=1 Tax=Bordetella genomosp. 10 TaxID=1416804 RepID=A0A261SB97_9BORD|nr:ABC transporter ATP-binding protein [Bordetella genomosp. 10]OZI34267.1 hypothetical protein CAL29_12050 [Bordetella genomosp. 10]